MNALAISSAVIQARSTGNALYHRNYLLIGINLPNNSTSRKDIGKEASNNRNKEGERKDVSNGSVNVNQSLSIDFQNKDASYYMDSLVCTSLGDFKDFDIQQESGNDDKNADADESDNEDDSKEDEDDNEDDYGHEQMSIVLLSPHENNLTSARRSQKVTSVPSESGSNPKHAT
jgi:hypothetical protein